MRFMAGAEVLVAGALHWDVVVDAPHLPARDETVTGRAVAYRMGGKGGNQAVAAARMGAHVAMAGAVGQDGFADALLSALDAAGVDRTRVARLPGPSGMSVAVVEPSGDYGAVIVSGANLGIRAESVGLPPGCRALVLQNEIPEAVNFPVAQRAAGAGMRVILNAAPARPAGSALLALVDLLVVNRVEAAQMTGCDTPRQALVALAATGPKAVIVTLGADGLIGVDNGAGFAQPAPKVSVISTHGAGDAFLGALVAEWLRCAALPEAARFGQMAAALTVATPPDDRARITQAMVRAAL